MIHFGAPGGKPLNSWESGAVIAVALIPSQLITDLVKCLTRLILEKSLLHVEDKPDSKLLSQIKTAMFVSEHDAYHSWVYTPKLSLRC